MRTYCGATQAPTWMPTWCVHGVNSDIGRSGLNRAIGRLGLNRAIRRSGLNRAIGWLKSHGVESASWATIPPITRDLTAEITWSKIGVTSHKFCAIRRLKSHGVKSTSWAMSHQFRGIRRLKSHGVKSTSWATIHQFRTNLSINRPHLQCKIHPLVSLLMKVVHWDQGCYGSTILVCLVVVCSSYVLVCFPGI